MHVGVAYIRVMYVLAIHVRSSHVMVVHVSIRSDRVMHLMVWNGSKMDVWAEMAGQCITEQGTRGECI
jgi:hypothetical protein